LEDGPLSGSGRRAADAIGGWVGKGPVAAPFDFQDKAMNLDSVKGKWMAAATAAASTAALEEIRVEALGKKGEITGLMKGLGGLSPEERRSAGAALNEVKDAVTGAIEARRAALAEADLAERLARDRVDVTLPARPEPQGKLHPISQTIDEIIAIFGEMGFRLAEGPDIEDDFHNFTALNIPPDHPARQMHDTFYLPARPDGSRMVLRTHTSPVQVRTMRSSAPPLRIIVPGRTYRCDSDMTHTPMFHQVEGLVVDKSTHMGHLKGCIIDFCRAFFGVADLPVRFRPSFFPFTEPSAEVDIGCSRQGGELKLGAYGDWLEILGSGMVHPKVLDMCGINSSEYQGFAFGMGIERIAMLKYGIPDLRTFFEADLRWLRHYGFLPLEVPSLVGGPTR
jgi:phenylalanyl-tRNA synthetase alpha chain